MTLIADLAGRSTAMIEVLFIGCTAPVTAHGEESELQALLNQHRDHTAAVVFRHKGRASRCIGTYVRPAGVEHWMTSEESQDLRPGPRLGDLAYADQCSLRIRRVKERFGSKYLVAVDTGCVLVYRKGGRWIVDRWF